MKKKIITIILAILLPVLIFANDGVNIDDEILTPGVKNIKKMLRPFSPIDLTKLKWIAKEGFSPEDKNGFKITTKTKAILNFPVSLNQVFNVKWGNKTNHFAMMSKFHLNPSTIKYPRPLAIHFSFIGENWRVYINGHLIADEIHLSKDGDIVIRRNLRNAVISFNKDILNEGENTLVIHMVGNAPPLPFLNNPELGFYSSTGYKIDTLDKINWENSEIINMYLNGMTILFGIFFIIFYFVNHERYNIYYGVLCLTVSIRFFFMSPYAYELIFNTNIITRLELASTYMLLPPLLYFLRNMFFKDDLKYLISLRIISAISILTAVLNFFLPYRMVTTIFRIWQFSMLPFMVFAVLFIMALFKKNKGDATNVAVYIGIVILGGIWDNFDSIFFLTGIKLLEPAMFILLVRFAVISIRNFINMTKETQRLNIELTKQKNAFYRFVPINFINLLNHESAVDITTGDSIGEEMSILFSDIRSFTSISERLTPEDNFKFLNEYLKEMEPCIQRNDGFVDKYIGDAVLALFSNKEVAGKNSSDRSVRAAIEMQNSLKILNKKRQKDGETELRIGIGINTGPLMLGTLGSDNRLDTTVIGNTVNLASRLESLTSFYKIGLIVSENTLESLTSKDDLFYRQIDNVIVKGKSEAVKIYEIFNHESNEVIDKKNEIMKYFTKGFDLYTQGEFKSAHKQFVNAYKIFPEDPVNKILALRCQKLMKNPPKNKWTGVFAYSSKTGE